MPVMDRRKKKATRKFRINVVVLPSSFLKLFKNTKIYYFLPADINNILVESIQNATQVVYDKYIGM